VDSRPCAARRGMRPCASASRCCPRHWHTGAAPTPALSVPPLHWCAPTLPCLSPATPPGLGCPPPTAVGCAPPCPVCPPTALVSVSLGVPGQHAGGRGPAPLLQVCPPLHWVVPHPCPVCPTTALKCPHPCPGVPHPCPGVPPRLPCLSHPCTGSSFFLRIPAQRTFLFLLPWCCRCTMPTTLGSFREELRRRCSR